MYIWPFARSGPATRCRARSLGVIAATVAMLLAMAGIASAQAWPTRPVTLVVPFAAGSTPDAAARVIADRLAPRLGQPVVVENRAGASGNTGTGVVARAEPDGYTIGVSIVGPLVVNPILFAKMPYDPRADLALVMVLAQQPSILVASNDLGIRDPAALAARIAADGGRLNFGSIGNGSLSHLAMEAVLAKTGARPVHVPFTGSPAVLTALIRGDVQMAVLPAGSVASQGASGQVALLAVTSRRRSALLPDLPTLGEAGLADVSADAWIGLIAPARTDPAILARLDRDVRAVLSEEGVRDRLRGQYLEVVASTRAEFAALLDAERAFWEPVIRQNNITIGQ